MIRPIQVNLQSTDVADEGQLFLLPEETIETEEEIQPQKEQAQQNARNKNTTKIKLSTIETYTFGAIKEDARIRVEQDVDLVFEAIKRRVVCEKYDKHLLQIDPKERHLLVHENRLIVKDGIIMRKYYGECGQITHLQILIPEHLITDFLKAFHGQMGKHPRITKMIQECRSNHYYPGLAKRIKQWVLKCQDCIKYKRICNNQIRPYQIRQSKKYVLETNGSRARFSTSAATNSLNLVAWRELHGNATESASSEPLPTNNNQRLTLDKYTQ